MFIIGLILGVFVMVFVLQNVTAVSVVFLNWNFEGSLAWIIILAVLLGMIISWLLSLPDLLKLSDVVNHNRKLQKDLDTHRHKLIQTEEKLAEVSKPIITKDTILFEE